MPAILRRNETKARSGLGSTSTLYHYIEEGLWPPGVRVGKRSVGWPENEVEAINAARISGATDEQIRQLVRRLVRARKQLAAA